MMTVRFARLRAERQTSRNIRYGFPQRGRAVSVPGSRITCAVNVLRHVNDHRPMKGF